MKTEPTDAELIDWLEKTTWLTTIDRDGLKIIVKASNREFTGRTIREALAQAMKELPV